MTRLSKLSRSLVGKTAIVTGAASGMGRATAFLLADEGANAAVVDLDQTKVDAVVLSIQSEYGAQRAIGFAVDVRDTEQLQTVVDKTVSAFGSLDIVINNAGISLFTRHAISRRLLICLGYNFGNQLVGVCSPHSSCVATFETILNRSNRERCFD